MYLIYYYKDNYVNYLNYLFFISCVIMYVCLNVCGFIGVYILYVFIYLYIFV